SIRLLGPDGSIAWQADGTARASGASSADGTVVIGQAPTGFTDVVALVTPLDPEATYEVQRSVLPAEVATASAADADAFAAFGQAATCRPADLAPGTVWYQGRAIASDAFAHAPCDTTATI